MNRMPVAARAHAKSPWNEFLHPAHGKNAIGAPGLRVDPPIALN